MVRVTCWVVMKKRCSFFEDRLSCKRESLFFLIGSPSPEMETWKAEPGVNGGVISVMWCGAIGVTWCEWCNVVWCDWCNEGVNGGVVGMCSGGV